MFSYILIIFAAFGGFLLAFHIHHKKTMQENMVCPLQFRCDVVIYSDYSRIFGIPVELLGMLYYGMVAIAYGIFLAMPYWSLPGIVAAVLIASAAAFIFSLYLTFVQAIILRQWCSWCLMSAALCTFIFLLAALPQV